MYKREIDYVDFNGNERSEAFYFHLSLPEVTRIEASVAKDGETTIKNHIEELVSNNKLKDLLDFLEHVILSSYGTKTADGRSFHKTEELKEEFSNSPAYAEFFEQLLTKEGLAQEFGEKVADNGQGKKNRVVPKVVTNPEQE